MSGANGLLQLAFNLIYLIALSGTSFWFASDLLAQNKSVKAVAVFVLIGLAFATAYIGSMLFWVQNYANLVFPSYLALIATYSPQIFMFLAAMFTAAFVFRHTSAENSHVSLKSTFLLFVPAFLLPPLWDGYKDGLINFAIRDVAYLGLGYASSEWYFVSFYLMAFLAYIIALKELTKRSDHSLAFSLILWGVISFPWNGLTPLKAGYSSIPGNVLSLSSIITGASLLKNRGGKR